MNTIKIIDGLKFGIGFGIGYGISKILFKAMNSKGFSFSFTDD